jgi:hypothetical protein
MHGLNLEAFLEKKEDLGQTLRILKLQDLSGFDGE